MPPHAGTLPVIDAHHHLWDLDRHSYPWLTPGTASIVGDTAAIRRNYLAEDFRADTAEMQLVATVHLDGGFDPRDPVGETRFVQGVFEREGFPNAIVGSVPLDRPDAAALMDAHAAASPLFRGVRQIVAWHENPALSYVQDAQMMQNPQWRRGFALLAPRGLSFDLQVFPAQMADAARLAQDFPHTRIIVNQAGLPDGLLSGDMGPWRDGLRRLAACGHVAIKISGLGMIKPGWTDADMRMIVETVVEAFGADRVMFGSNFPVDRLFGSYRALFHSVLRAMATCSLSEQVAFFAGNARRIYRPAQPKPMHAGKASA